MNINLQGLDLFYFSMSILLLAVVLVSLPSLQEHSRTSRSHR